MRETDYAARVWDILTQHGLSLLPIPAENGTQVDESLIIFALGPAHYGIPAYSICAIQALEAYTPLPFTHPWIAGIVTVDGRRLLMLDVCPLLTKARKVIRTQSPLLIVHMDSMEVALLVDHIVAVPPAAMELLASASMFSPTGRNGIIDARAEDTYHHPARRR